MRAALLIICLAAMLREAQPADVAVDLELVLAVDASASVDEGEFRLQLKGIADGFRDPAVLAAIRSGSARRIAVNLLVWAEANYPKDSTGWAVIAGEADARRFAGVVETFPRRVTGGTGIGDGIAHALRALDASGFSSGRRVVDVSGDGRETAARDFTVLMPAARAMAIARDATINGLAILNEVPDLDEWYRDHVQIGTDSFVMAARTYEDFAEAMRRKLLREIDQRPRLSAREAIDVLR